MKVLIDGRPLQTPSRLRGIGRYVGHILQACAGEERARVLFFRGDDAPGHADRTVRSASPRRLITLSDSFFLPPLFRRQGISVYHSTAYALPRRARNVRYLLTVYDLTLRKHPQGSSWRHRLVFRRIIASARRADLILPISDATAGDLRELAGVDPARMRVIRPMLDGRIAPEHAQKPAAPLPGEFLLYVGGADASKNLETLLRAVPPLGIPLVLAGGIAKKRAAELLLQVPQQNRSLIFFVGHVPDRELAWLYGSAAALVLPSLNEGFGYPPLEALRCGTPAVVSRAGALPEVLEDAAVFVDAPRDADEWIAKTGRLLRDSDLRRELLDRGRRLLPHFAPHAFRERLEHVYFGEGQGENESQ